MIKIKKLSKSKNVYTSLFLVILIMLVFLIGNQFHERLQTSAFMEYNTGEFKCFAYEGLEYELPTKWFSEIKTSDGLYKNIFEDVDNKLYGSFEIFVDNKTYFDDGINIEDSNDFLRSNIIINGINYVLLENKVLSENGTITRNFNYYTVQNNKRVKVCFSSFDKNIKENITVLFENILSRIKF